MTTKVVTGKVRFSYFSALTARRNEMNGKDEFSTQVLVPKTDVDTVAQLKSAAKAALVAKFGDKIPKNVRNPLRDGDTELKSDGASLSPEYAGHYFFNTKSATKPGAVDNHGQDIINNTDIVSGDYGRVSLNAYAYDTAGNKGVSFGLNHVMLISKGESLGGAKSSAASDFGMAGKATPPAAESIDSDW